ncbi:MAG: tyrosine-type recombinase/integrase [Bdellovibrionales bacterium]|nr:tyrosine-type recombinase/integrase [Bdellovibrionales bacterium]
MNIDTEIPEKNSIPVSCDQLQAPEPIVHASRNSITMQRIQDYRQIFGQLPSQEQGLLFSWLYQKAPHTRRYYQRVWVEFLDLFENSVRSLKEIEIGHLVVFLKSKTNLKAASQNLTRNSLSSFLTFLTKTGFFERNPAVSLSPIRVPNRIGSKILSNEQILRMHDLESSPRNRAIMKLLYFSGMRVGELCSLKIGDIRRKEASHSLIQILGKGAITRNLLVPNEIIEEIWTYRIEHNLGVDPQSPLFMSTKEPCGSLSTTQVFRIIKKAAKRAKIDPVPSPHWFRHTSATHALENGAPIHVVQKTLGHQNIATTGRYLEANPKESSSQWLKWIPNDQKK